MLEKGFLASTSVYTSYSHKETHIRAYIEAVDDTFSFIARSIKNGNAKKYLKGPICHVGFKRLT
jgi:glutamate-1-semialdehyde 2,1-aminomutase